MPNPETASPPNRFALANGLQVDVMLIPTARPNAEGRYPLLGMTGGKPVPKIFVKFWRELKVVDCKPWHVVICGEDQLTLEDGTVLGIEELELIDRSGWEFMLTRGMVPNQLV